MMKKKLFIFDAYGTLLSTGDGSLKATQKILALQPREIDAKVFYSEWKKYHRAHMDEANAGTFCTEAEIFAKDLTVLYEKYGIERDSAQDVQFMLDSLIGRKCFEEVKEVLDNLRKKYRVVIGSTTDTEPLLINMKVNGVTVDAVYTSEMIGKYKPSSEFYEYILQKENCKPGEAVFVGDSLTDDVLGPKQVGITTILIDRNGKYDGLTEIKPDYMIAQLKELAEFAIIDG